MFGFYLKKLIGMMLMPIPLTICGILIGLWLLKRYPRHGKGLIVCSTLLLALTSWHPVADRLLRPFEDNYPMFDATHSVDAVVVLGGCHHSNDKMPLTSQLCGTSIYRLLEGLRILQHNPGAELLVSGYAAGESRIHADISKEVAITQGVKADRIRTFPTARDTQQEAQLMHPVLTGKRFALVTEASHLPRAMRYFQQQGLQPVAAPAIQNTADSSDWRINASAQKKSERAFYEALGQLWQSVTSQ